MMEKRFDKRLDAILHAARIRLMERLRYAYFHGRAEEYLWEIHFADALAPELAAGKLLALERAAVDLLERRITYARRKGYLRSYLSEIRMMDLLVKRKHVRTVLPPRASLYLVSSSRGDEPITAREGKSSSRANVRLVK